MRYVGNLTLINILLAAHSVLLTSTIQFAKGFVKISVSTMGLSRTRMMFAISIPK
ncbi:hypothetical protein NST74_11540 [Paenibacillus sp. FSL F4-0125]|uniref:hypothetical protein n=1 Tax=Paenibacillus sp. FSL F4-0125 TaxID=2954730 RepID=UPI0030FCA153